MFKAKNILTFSLVLAVIIVAWKVSLDNKPQSDIVKITLFPDLIEKINEISTVTIEDRKFLSLLKKIDGTWRIHNKDNYPASTTGIKRLAFELSNLRILETKTSSVEKYAKLGVSSLSEKNSKASKIILNNGTENIASLLVGLSPKTARKPQYYIRLVDQPTAKLVDGEISAPTNPIDWLDPKIIDLDTKRIKELKIVVPNQKEIIISKNTALEDFFLLQGVPDDSEIKSKTITSSIPAVLRDLRLNDVISAKKLDNLTPFQETTISTFDGLKVTMLDYSFSDKSYTVFKINLENSQNELSEKSINAAKTEIDNIKNRTEHWAYEIPTYKRRMINRKFSDLIKKKPEVDKLK